MKPILTTLLAAVALAALPALSSAQTSAPAPAAGASPKAAAAQPLTIAILDFQTSGREFEKKGEEAAALLNVHLSKADNLLLVERQELEKILGEQELGMGGNVTPDTAAKVGQLTGAKVIVTGRVFGAGERFFAVAKIISAETGRVYGEVAPFAALNDIAAAVAALAPKVQGVIAAKGDTLVAKVESPEARLERLAALVKGRKLPTVSVRVGEQHLNHAVADPAVETELCLVLRQLGFAVNDTPVGETATAAPEIRITGEAFSELGSRRGNLVSCRSRVEIKVTRAADGKALLIDRQSDVAVDIAENIAGKTALQNAALKLLDRIVPALAE